MRNEVIEDGITGKMVDSEEEAITALPEILSYDRRAVWQRFEERFTATRMANNYVSIYRQLLRMRTSNGKMQSTWPRQLHVNGVTPVSIELPALVEAGANPEAPF